MAVQNPDFTTFLKVYQMTKKWEGGFSNNANDVGGYTYAGITQGSYDSFMSSRGKSSKDVATLSEDEIHHFYYEDRWKPIMLDGFGPDIGIALFDISVNFQGPGDAWGFVAEAYGQNANGDYLPDADFSKWKDTLMTDIKSGKITEKEFANKIMGLRKDYYIKQVEKYPSQMAHFDGWMNRINDIYAQINGTAPAPNCLDNRQACTDYIPSNGEKFQGGPATGSSNTSSSFDSGYASTNKSGLGIPGAVFARYPLPFDIRMRKCFEGYQKVASTLMSVGGMGNISGPPIAKDMTAASESASKGDKEGSANNELPAVDYGGYWADPCPKSLEFTSPYTTNRGGSPHPGVDIAADSGTPVLASAPGTVADVFYQPGGFGNLVVVSHNVGGKIVYSAYNHLLDNSTKVKVGDKVERGQHLADIGSTGISSGPHLHFEIRTDWAGSRGDVLNTHADPACLLDRYASKCGYADTTFKIVPKPNK